ncbi:hypothetical protein [Streptomyces sp. NPDC006335]|uniref:hypothetical protein n=1 Tax=Streptomyces sp. NPDC006335 TaxID=3156895 RepID=UPI0033BBA84E
MKASSGIGGHADIESRGFLLGAAVAVELGVGVVAVPRSDRVLLVGDWIGMGGQASAVWLMVRSTAVKVTERPRRPRGGK